MDKENCPRCRDGLLYAIAQTEDGTQVKCFNCDYSASVPGDADAQEVFEAGLTERQQETFQQANEEHSATSSAGAEPSPLDDEPPHDEDNV